MDIVFVAIGLVVAGALAFTPQVLARVRLLIPTDPTRPIPDGDAAVLYRYVKLGGVVDASAWRPRVLLALTLAVLIALLLKLAFTPAASWDMFLIALAIAAGAGLIVGGNPSNAFAVAMLTALPLVVLFFGSISDQGIGIFAGLFIGGYAGIFVFRNYVTLLQRLRLELAHRETADGKALGGFGLLWRRAYLAVLALVPLAVLYQTLALAIPDIELQRIAAALDLPQSGRFALFTLALGLGLNVVVFTVPLFREMLERASQLAASDFTTIVRAMRDKEKPGDDPGEGDDGTSIERAPDATTGEGAAEPNAPGRRERGLVLGDPKKRAAEFCDAQGRWRLFQSSQMFPITLAVTYLVAIAVAQTLNKAIDAAIIPADSASSDLLTRVANIAGGFALCANATLLFGLVAYWGTRLVRKDKRGREAAERNVLALWQAARRPDVRIAAYREGAEPVIAIVDAAGNLVAADAQGTEGSGEPQSEE